MARPMMMIGYQQYQKIHQLVERGVKNEAIIRQEGLSLKGPTFRNKMRLFSAYKGSKGELKDRIHGSLFPKWVLLEIMGVQIQDPAKWRYIGDMPYGFWVEVDPK